MILKRGRLYSSEARVLGTGVGEALFGILEETYMYTYVNWRKGGLAEGQRRWEQRRGGGIGSCLWEWEVAGWSVVFLLYSVGFVFTR